MSTSLAAVSGTSSVERIAERVREANVLRRPLRIAGAGTWTHAVPPDATLELSMQALDQVIEYVPGDLTITVGAAMSLAAIERLTAENGQWLTLDPFGSPDGTIGATVASASSGPLATCFGTPRDVVLGVEAVMGTGAIARAGGRVVKNVAGFDLTRVLTGSRGTIGALTEISLRLRALPAVDETVAIRLGQRSSVREMLSVMRSWPAPPMAAELITSRTASALGLREGTTLLLRFGGNKRLVTAMIKRATTLGPPTPLEPSIWLRLRALDVGMPVSFRVSDLPTAFPERWEDVVALGGDEALMSASLLRGQVRCMMQSVERSQMAGFRARAQSATLVYDSLPSAAAWNSLTSVPAESSLHARIIDAFDPVGVMNPGAMRLAR